MLLTVIPGRTTMKDGGGWQLVVRAVAVTATSTGGSRCHQRRRWREDSASRGTTSARAN